MARRFSGALPAGIVTDQARPGDASNQIVRTFWNPQLLSTAWFAESDRSLGRGMLLYSTRNSSIINTMEIDPASPIPLHEQVAAAIRRAIADGEARPGGRLPPARDLAAVLGVNPNTVFRSLHTLRDEGLLEFRRGRGVTVTGAAPQNSAIVTKARELVALARRMGYRREELAKLIEQVS